MQLKTFFEQYLDDIHKLKTASVLAFNSVEDVETPIIFGSQYIESH